MEDASADDERGAPLIGGLFSRILARLARASLDEMLVFKRRLGSLLWLQRRRRRATQRHRLLARREMNWAVSLWRASRYSLSGYRGRCGNRVEPIEEQIGVRARNDSNVGRVRIAKKLSGIDNQLGVCHAA